MDNFGFIEYRPLSCKLASLHTLNKKNRFTFPRGGGTCPPPCPCLRAPMNWLTWTRDKVRYSSLDATEFRRIQFFFPYGLHTTREIRMETRFANSTFVKLYALCVSVGGN